MNKKGSLIVFYGINNTGKTTQAKLLMERLIKNGICAEYFKYPAYELEPSGVMIDDYLRHANPYSLTAREAQILYILNRTQIEPMILEKMDDGITIVAEDYIGTGIAWGEASGIDSAFLRHINTHLITEDMAFLFEGKRFEQAEENGHRHESDNFLLERAREKHRELADEFGWIAIKSDRTLFEVHNNIWEEIKNAKLFEQKNSGKNDMKNESPFSGAQIKQKFQIPDERLDKIASDDVNNDQAMTSVEHSSMEQPQDNKHILGFELIHPLAKQPERAHKTDAGLDLFSAEYQTLMPGERALVKTGVRFALPNNCAGFIWDKSGIAKSGVHALAGVIDNGYRGEIIVNLINLSNNIYTIAPGQKIAQIVIQKMEIPELQEVKIENNTDRSENGFGSTGV